MTSLYPECPENADLAFAAPTLLFRQQIVKALGYVVLFFILYVVLLLAALALAVVLISGGVWLFRTNPAWTTGVLGLCLTLPGVMVLFFLAKFLFNRHQQANPYRIEIFADNQPGVFDFVARLVKDMRIRFPEKIFIVPDMNANVFYQSGLRSLFRPGHRNLEIGLGLINSVNISEFKMLLAFEFAHFSQRSMKLGSYIYSVNKILYNMLYENDRWQEAEHRWRYGGGLFGFFARITTRILNMMQYVLRKIYAMINRQYLELSREMEFYADTIAVGLSSSAIATSSLRRVEMAGYCLDHCFHKLSELSDQTLRFSNIFTVQRALVQYYAAQYHLEPDAAGLPVITDNYFHNFLKSRVQLREQWTSHLSREAREAHYIQADISCRINTDSAWRLFNIPEKLQEQMTARVYRLTPQPQAIQFAAIAPAAYISELARRHQQYEYPRMFNDYYDNRPFSDLYSRQPLQLPPEEMQERNLQTLYHPDVVWRMRSFFRDRQDAETLQAISSGQFQTNYFEFDGQKYSMPRARQLARMLSEKVTSEMTWLEEHDQDAFRYHYTKAAQLNQDTAALVKEKYAEVLRYQEMGLQLNEQVFRIIHCISQVFNNGEQDSPSVPVLFGELSTETRKFQEMVEKLSAAGLLKDFPPEMAVKLAWFREQNNTFLHGMDMVPDYPAIQELHEICSAIMEHFNNSVILLKKSYLEFVLTLEPANNNPG